MKHTLLISLSFGGVFLLASCGGDIKTITAPTSVAVPPPTPVTSVVLEGVAAILTHPLRADGWYYYEDFPFVTTAAGTIDITVDWTHASNNVDIRLAAGVSACIGDKFSTCPWIAQNESAVAKPEKISMPNMGAGNYTLYVSNYGATDESIGFLINLVR